MSKETIKKAVSLGLATIMVTGSMVVSGGITTIAATNSIVAGNEADVGVYTNGLSHVSDIGDPTYLNVDAVKSILEPGVAYTAGSMYQSIFEKDLANGGTSYYLDRILGVKGTLNGGTSTNGNSNNAVLQTRGRSLYMRGSSTTGTMGFAGTAFAGGPTSLGNFYTVAVEGLASAEISADRFNAPSYFSSKFTIGGASSGITADMKKFITFDNVATTTINFNNATDQEITIKVNATSPIARTAVEEATDEFVGKKTLMSGSNNGLIDTPWNDVTIRLKAKDFETNGINLTREITIPANGSSEISVVGVLYSNDIPESIDRFYEYANLEPAEAFKQGVTAFNRRWAEDIPYINVPNPAIEKAIVYRWWGERYNSLDTNTSGHVYQFPVTIEGVNLYQNAVVLTQPMHLQDTKWQRTPYLAYGQIFNVGALSGSSALLDSPGHTSWNNHYSQYMGTASLEAYKVHGGGADVANTFAYYFEHDGIGQLEHYDGDGDKLIGYNTNYMPGNDSDAISFGFSKTNTGNGGTNISRPESAYVWGDFVAASELYAIAGNNAKVPEMNQYADDIQEAVLGLLWCDECKMFEARTTRDATTGRSGLFANTPHSAQNTNLIPAKESNLYDVYAENIIPMADKDKYTDGFRFLTYGDNFPIFPFYTANQYDKTKWGIGGSNNFSNINFTVQYRAVRSALRYYDTTQKYIAPKYTAQLLDWMAWSTYPMGDLLVANQAEYYSGWNETNKTYNRNNRNHIMLGNMNYIFIEDMCGIMPRADETIELWPIDLGYDYFMVNNLRYHNQDVTIVWDKDGSKYNLGAGYSLFINGDKKVTVDKLGKFTYNPNTNEVTTNAGITVVFTAATTSFMPTAKNTLIDDERVISYMKKAGIDLDETNNNLAKSATITASFTQIGERPTVWRNFHTPGRSGAMNYDPGAIAVNERPANVNAVTDGVTVNEPYWGNFATANEKDWVELDFGEAKTFDNIKVFFVSDRQAGGYKEPLKYSIQAFVNGKWESISNQYKSPKTPSPNFNEVLFNAITTDKIRVLVTNQPTFYTAITEIQVFNSGREIPVVINDAPKVTALVDTTKNGNLTTGLVATVTDDGLPEDGQLTFNWSIISAPEGGVALISNPNDLSTMVACTVEGEYVFKFEANDSQLTTAKTVTVAVAKKAVTTEFGATGAITTSGSASWENPLKVNDPTTPNSSSPGTNNGWGCWGQTQNGTTVAKTAWIQYAWDDTALINSTQIYWYDDNGGTRAPTADGYKIQYSKDGITWLDVNLKNSSTYADGIAISKYNVFEFDTIEAKYLRVSISKLAGAGAGTGVLRWRVFGENIESVDGPVIMRVVEGTIPAFPSSHGVTYANGYKGKLDFVWQPITAEMVAETNVEPFTVIGANTAYGLFAEAKIYVRPEMGDEGIVISSFEELRQQVNIGETPYLPSKIMVSYNDGSRDNQAHEVVWDYDASMVQKQGTYELKGTISYPSTVGKTDAYPIFTLKVVNPNAVSTELTLEMPEKEALGKNVTIVATVSPSVEGQITFKVDGIQVGAPIDTIDGKATIDLPHTSLGNVGLKEITAVFIANDINFNDSYASASIEIYSIQSERITINAGRLVMIENGATMKIDATVYPTTSTNTTITWKSTKPSVLSIDANGVMTAYKTGIVFITATCDGQEDQIMVRVVS